LFRRLRAASSAQTSLLPFLASTQLDI